MRCYPKKHRIEFQRMLRKCGATYTTVFDTVILGSAEYFALTFQDDGYLLIRSPLVPGLSLSTPLRNYAHHIARLFDFAFLVKRIQPKYFTNSNIIFQ